MMPIIIWTIVALLVLFSATVVVLFVRETAHLRLTGDARARLPLRERWRDYFGPIDRHRAPLSPPLRVAAEFFSAIFGFPGIGWMAAGRIQVGLPLLVVVPALLWMFYPLYISSFGIVLERPLAGLAVLPPLAVVSAGALAIAEFGLGRR